MATSSEVFQALADPTRWEIVRLLAEGPRCVCELTESLEVPQITLSTHLQVLRASGLVLAERRGRWMYYAISRGSRPLLRSLWKHFPLPAPAGSTAVLPVECCRDPALVIKTTQPV